MSLSFLAAAVSAVAAAVLTGMLVRRCTRLPRLDLVAWSIAGVGLTIALAVQAAGYHQGFSPITFRAVQIGGRLIAPLALAWGLVEVGGRTFMARFGARLVLIALLVVGGVILTLDPLGTVTFTTAWPSAGSHYQPIPNAVLLVIAAVTAIWSVVALIVAGVRAQGEPGWRELFPAVGAGAAAAVLTEGLGVKLPVNAGYAALCLLAAALTWFAGRKSSGLRLTALHDTEASGDTGWNERYRATDTGYGLYRAETGGYGRVSSDTDFGGLYRQDPGRFGQVDSDTGFGDRYRPDTDGFGQVSSDTGYGFYRTDTDFGQMGNHRVGDESEPLPAVVETGDMLPVNFDVFTPAARDDTGDEETARLYGQIAIYTLIDGQAEEFDELAQAVVEKVKALEPDTLAFIVHGVPSAPLQRILYEVYRDETAFEEHGRQSYIQDFEEDRKPYVLATNVIELGVRQAKLTPLSGPQDPPGPPSRPPGGTGQGFRPENGQPSWPRDSGQYTQPRDSSQPSRPREASQRPREASQPSRPWDDGQYSRPRDGGQSSWPGDGGQYARPPENGQPPRPRDSGQYSRPPENGRPPRPRDGGQYSRPPENGRPPRPRDSGQSSRPRESGTR
jgi:quinol monooxygenase YgiN